MCSEASPPRLSFSHDLSELKILPMKQKSVPCNSDTLLLLDSNSDFEFNTSNILGFEPSSADELFYNGKILPIQKLQEKTTITTPKHTPYVKSPYTQLPPIPSPPSVDHTMKKESIRELLNGNKKQPHSKSFWRFSRSKSLNCDIKKNLACSNSPLFSRSNSTGSVSNPKKMSSNRQQYSSAAKSPSYYSCCSSLNLYPHMQKSPSGKSYGGSYYGNGLRVSPVLNVPTPCVSKGSANFFGLSSFFSVGKVKKNKK